MGNDIEKSNVNDNEEVNDENDDDDEYNDNDDAHGGYPVLVCSKWITNKCNDKDKDDDHSPFHSLILQMVMLMMRKTFDGADCVLR